MHRTYFVFFLFLLTVFSSCKKDDEADDPYVKPEILSLSNFAFLQTDNPDMPGSLYLDIDEEKISGRLPYQADINNLTANFDFDGSEVRIGNIVQKSGFTVNDFTEPLTYTVVGANGNTKDYIVSVQYFTSLPVIFIYTENSEDIASKEEYIQGTMSVNGIGLFEDVSGDMKIRGRGHSTWFLHPKKPYQLKFDDKTEVLGMPADKKWIFLAEYSDKSLLRNSLAFEMGYLSNLEWTPKCEFSEVFINDAYVGTYNITQKVEEGENRVNIGENGFLCEIDTPDHLGDDVFFSSSRFTIQVKEPEISTGDAEYEYIKNHIIQFEATLYSGDFKDPVNGYRKYIDVASFVDWYLINEIAKNVDSRDYSSMYFHHVPGEKIIMGPLWDFDLGFGNVDYADSRYPEGFWVKDHQWFGRLFEDPYFVERVKERFAFYRENTTYLLQLVEQKAKYLKYASAENDDRWNLFGTYVWPNPVFYDTYNEEVDHLKNWFIARMNWLDGAYDKL